MSEPFPPTPDESAVLLITPALIIPRRELQFRTSRSSGPGGQHVNKTESRVELLFDLNSPLLNDWQRERLWVELKPWLDESGIVHIIADQSRSQYRNREDAVGRFVALLQQALRPRKTRKATRVPRGAKEARLQGKRERSEVKRQRGRARGWDE